MSGLEVLLTVPLNTANRCPVLAVPSGKAVGGTLTGVQIVGPTYADERVFRVGPCWNRSDRGLAIHPGAHRRQVTGAAAEARYLKLYCTEEVQC